MLLFDFFNRFLIFAKSGSVVRRISWLTILGLTFSLAALVIVMSVMTALNQSQRQRTLAVEPHLTIEIPELNRIQNLMNHPVNYKLKAIPGAVVFPYESQDVILRTMDGKFKGAMARGIEWTSLQNTLDRVKAHLLGKRRMSEVNKPKPGEILIGVDLAHSLGVFEGDSLMVVPPEGLLLPPSEAPKYEKVRVAQIITTNVADFDSQIIFYIEGETLQSLKDSASRKIGLEVRLVQPDEAENTKQSLMSFADIKTQTWAERNSALFFALKLEKIMIGIFLGMAALVAGLSLISVLSLLISQKRKEIALLQTLGYSKRAIKRLFSSLGFMLAGTGIFLGLLIGVGISYYLELYPLNILPDIYYDSEIPAKVEFWFIFVLLAVSSGLALLGSKWIAASSANLSITSSLRGKN